MGLGPADVVRARPIAPPRVGLVAQGIVQTNVTGPTGAPARWTNGFRWEPENCSGGGVLDPCAATGKTSELQTDAGERTFEPYVVWVLDECSTFSYERYREDAEARVRRLLAARESKIIETEFWRGDLAISAGWADNQRLASLDADVVSPDGAGLSPELALHCLEQYLAECGNGERGMIHATRQVVSEWAGRNLLRKEGTQILTMLDTVVVAGAGYDGSAAPGSDAEGAPVIEAASGAVWAYATDMVEVKLSPVEVFATQVQAVDRDANTYTLVAERIAAATWDGCCHGAVAVDVDLCGIGGAGS